jgi:phospholipase C
MKFMRRSLPLIVALATTLAYAQNNIPQVQHVIVVIQENRTPTNLFHEDANLVANGAHVIPPANQIACGDKPMPPPSSKGCVNATKMSGITLAGLPLDAPVDPDHSHYPAWYCTYDGGKMDGACHIPVSQSGNVLACPEGQLQYCPYSYVQNIKPPNCRVQPCPGILDPYFHIAEQYGFANWMFQTNQGPSQPAHLFLFSGTSAPDFVNDSNSNCTSAGCWEYFVAENGPTNQQVGCTAPADTVVYELPPAQPQNPAWQQGYTPPGGTAGYPCYYSYDLVDLLGTKISWRYYNASGTGGFTYWNAPNMKHDICNPSPTDLPGEMCNYPPNVRVGNPGLVLNDLGASGNCDLQQVTWVIPDGSWSDHPGTGSYDGGPSWVAAIVNAVGNMTNFGQQLQNTPCSDTIKGQQVPYWQDTVVLVVWDDWGGFYDDVLPWGCNSQGVCSGYPGQPQSAQYVYGFRVPLLVVGAYVKQLTPQGGYVSGACTQNNCRAAIPYVHDFGSILNFIEAVFGLGEISPSYHYADFLGPDVFTSGNCTKLVCPYGLSDFFSFSQSPRPFAPIQGAKYDTGAFLNPTNYFPNYPSDPDDDAIDPQ